MAAPMTSSDVLPAGISCAVTCWSGVCAFQSLTICLPQAISSGLLDSHTLIGPVDEVEPELPPELPPPHAAVIASRSALTVAVASFLLIGDLTFVSCRVGHSERHAKSEEYG